MSALVLVAVGAPACSNNSSSSLPTTPSPTINTDILTGTVGVPVNGTLQSSSNTFVVGQGGGSVSVTLTSAVETLPGGTLLPNVSMGLGLGTPSGTTCAVLTNGFTTASPGGSPQLNGTLNAGTYCVQVSDITNQVGPVAYAVAVAHP